MSFRARLGPAIALTIALVAFGLWRLWPPSGAGGPGVTVARAPADALPALAGATGWLNGGPVRRDSLRGHVTVLVAWSDTDLPSLRALPEAEAWWRAYAPFGLRVIGVHVPDYAFAADPGVPAAAARRAGVTFPIALDGAYRIVSRLGAQEALPLILVADGAGHTAEAVRGESFARAHRAIRASLRRTSRGRGVGPDPEPAAEEAAPPPMRRVFCGTSRAKSGPLAAAAPGRTLTFTAQFRYQIEGEAFTPYMVGRWTPNAEAVTSTRGGAAEFVAVRSEGGEVSAVMGSATANAVRVWVLADDAWLGEGERGEDVRSDARGATWVDVAEPRLYAIARGVRPRGLKFSPEGPGVSFYEFAFTGVR